MDKNKTVTVDIQVDQGLIDRALELMGIYDRGGPRDDAELNKMRHLQATLGTKLAIQIDRVVSQAVN